MKKDILEQLAKSEFRNHFKLKGAERAYALQKGRIVIKQHAEDFISKRLAPAVIPNDGKQTPMHHHPVFIAQHATATCCRQCLCKWHGIPQGRPLTESEQHDIVELIMRWIDNQMKV